MTKFIIKKSDIVHNYRTVAAATDALVIPTLKANCYGLGACEVFELLKTECNVGLFAVSRPSEAFSLSGKGADILLLSCVNDGQSIQKAVDSGVILAVDSLALAKRIGEYAIKTGAVARVHIKIDTGFGRFGFMPTDIYDIKQVYAVDGIRVEGIFSHFSNAFDIKSDNIEKQFEKFKGVLSELEKGGIEVGLRHICGSSAAVRDKKYHLDAVRIGSALTGRLPLSNGLDLKRVGSFETKICDIRTLKKGSNIGYGNVFTLKRDTRVAVICAGSADGVLIKKDYDTYRVFDILRYGLGVFKMLFRDNRLCARVNGKTVRSVGRVALTHTFLDVTGIECNCSDTVTLDISPLYVADKVEREYI